MRSHNGWMGDTRGSPVNRGADSAPCKPQMGQWVELGWLEKKDKWFQKVRELRMLYEFPHLWSLAHSGWALRRFREEDSRIDRKKLETTFLYLCVHGVCVCALGAGGRYLLWRAWEFKLRSQRFCRLHDLGEILSPSLTHASGAEDMGTISTLRYYL